MSVDNSLRYCPDGGECPVCDGKYADERVSDRYCNCCGKRLEVESIDAGTIGGEMVQRALKKLEGEP